MADLLVGTVAPTLDVYIRLVWKAIDAAFKHYDKLCVGFDVIVGEGGFLSVEIQSDLDYPYEPAKGVRDVIESMGFRTFQFKFMNDVMDVEWDKSILENPNIPMTMRGAPDGVFYNSPDVVVGWGPRHSKYAKLTKHPIHGMVDSRFDQVHYEANYNFQDRKEFL